MPTQKPTQVGRKKILLIRLDKIGDLVCTLPVDEVLDPVQWDITWAISQGLGLIADHSIAIPERKYLELDKKDEATSRAKLRSWLQTNKPDYAISFNAPWWVNFELWKAKVPYRGGVKSQWHSFLFLNHAERQKRSRAEKHEADYNRDLLRPLPDQRIGEETPVLKLRASTNEQTALIDKYPVLQHPFVIVHPGMMGSALNIPTHRYVQLILDLQLQINVVITGTKSDEPYVKPVLDSLRTKGAYIKKLSEATSLVTGLKPIIDATEQLNMTEMLALLSKANHVYAPSTGVLHLAASLGVDCTGFFSPIKVHHPIRWGARRRLDVPQSVENRLPLDTSNEATCMDTVSVETAQ